MENEIQFAVIFLSVIGAAAIVRLIVLRQKLEYWKVRSKFYEDETDAVQAQLNLSKSIAADCYSAMHVFYKEMVVCHENDFRPDFNKLMDARKFLEDHSV